MYMAYLLITIILPVLKQNLSNTHVFWTSFLFQTKNYLNITSNKNFEIYNEVKLF